jgi:ferrous iron transport protein B
MTFPGLSEDQVRSFENLRRDLARSFLSSPDVRGRVGGAEDLSALNALFASYRRAEKEEDRDAVARLERSPLFPVLGAILFLEKGKFASGEMDPSLLNTAARYLQYRKDMAEVAAREQGAALKGTLAGRMGLLLETVTRPLGFDYRTNIALVGGFAAKEVVVSTLGTAYSLGSESSGGTGSLSLRLRNEPGWNPLKAFTLLIFTMLYVPCFVTVIMIRKETSWKWAGFSICFNLLTAYIVALVITLAGKGLGIGL